jgi:hypothetical protein
MTPETWTLAGTAVVAVASLLANVLPAHTIAGKICHFLALNFFHLLNPESQAKPEN